MKFKQKSEIIQESKMVIKGNEPFLSFHQIKMIVNLHNHSGQSHNFLDGFPVSFGSLRQGDVLKFQMVREYPIEMKWYERILDWIRSLK